MFVVWIIHRQFGCSNSQELRPSDKFTHRNIYPSHTSTELKHRQNWFRLYIRIVDFSFLADAEIWTKRRHLTRIDQQGGICIHGKLPLFTQPSCGCTERNSCSLPHHTDQRWMGSVPSGTTSQIQPFPKGRDSFVPH